MPVAPDIFFDQYRSLQVSPLLSKYIDCVWIEGFSRKSEYRDKDFLIVPDNTVELIFTAYGIERRCAKENTKPVICHSHLAGLKTKPQVVRIKGEILVAVRFKPLGLYRFTDVPLTETIDESIPTEYLFGSEIRILEDQLLNVLNLDQQVALINNFFIQRLTRSKQEIDPLFESVCGEIERTSGNVRIYELASFGRVSVKTLERRFKQKLGISPKHYMQVVRFFSTVKKASKYHEASYSALAHAGGYYDQMHFVKEMKRFTGFTPSQFFEMERAIQAPIFMA